jgi:hypothetical protein
MYRLPVSIRLLTRCDTTGASYEHVHAGKLTWLRRVSPADRFVRYSVSFLVFRSLRSAVPAV